MAGRIRWTTSACWTRAASWTTWTTWATISWPATWTSWPAWTSWTTPACSRRPPTRTIRTTKIRATRFEAATQRSTWTEMVNLVLNFISHAWESGAPVTPVVRCLFRVLDNRYDLVTIISRWLWPGCRSFNRLTLAIAATFVLCNAVFRTSHFSPATALITWSDAKYLVVSSCHYPSAANLIHPSNSPN